MQTTYVGHYRLPLWQIIAGPLLIGAAAWMTWSVADDASYAEMIRDPHGLATVLYSLPRPALLAFAAFGVLFFVVAYGVLGWAAAAKKLSFAIEDGGIRQYMLFTGKARFIAWLDIRSVMAVKQVRIFSGVGADGRPVSVSVSTLGHDRGVVFDAICAHRPDLRPYL